MTITAKVEGVDKLARGLGTASASLAGEVRQAMTAGLILIEGDARRNVKQDTRRLSGSITHRISGSGAALTGEVGPSARYGAFVEFGRKPGKMPPIAAIEGWARRHGVHPFLVARAIGRRGIPPAPFMAPAFERNKPRIEQLFGQLGVKVVGRIVGGS
jgi:HK97 gp10 family phage protein